jgi:hypothetical protein
MEFELQLIEAMELVYNELLDSNAYSINKSTVYEAVTSLRTSKLSLGVSSKLKQLTTKPESLFEAPLSKVSKATEKSIK